MFFFLLTGERLLNLFGVSIHAFALAGAVIILASSIELIFGVSLFKEDHSVKGIALLCRLPFPCWQVRGHSPPLYL
jgi:small neutral amino acid transporter SnatA (MarC family)